MLNRLLFHITTTRMAMLSVAFVGANVIMGELAAPTLGWWEVYPWLVWRGGW